ncbi:MAG: FAD-dependent oxidoreductase [Planctomycetes bacterium]|nr:FAD-dependent oxidoreductase [Planctomycetota bacterium]
MNRTRIGIIGGGPGGLMAAYLLQKYMRAPFAATIFEAGSRLGGKVVTRQFDTAPVGYEAGAAELYDYSQLGPDPLRELVAELGLTTSPMWGDAVVLGDQVLETYADVRRAFGAAALRELKRFDNRAWDAISPAEYYESDWKEDNANVLSRKTFRALLATIRDERVREYVRVCVHSDLATEPHKTSAMYGLQNYLMNEPEYMRLYTIDGGIERLTQELARRVTATVNLRHTVTRVERRPEGYAVTFRHNGQFACEEFDYLVVALPNNWLPAIEWGGPALSAAMDQHHRHYDHPAHYLRVSALFDAPFWRDRVRGSYFMIDAFGGTCVYDESARAAAGTYGVLGWLLAGEPAATMSNLSDDELISAVLDTFPRCLGAARPHFLEGRVHRWVGAVNGLPGGYPMQPPEVRHRPEPVGHPGLFVVGDYLFDSTLNGVLDSAELVVDKITDAVHARPAPAGTRSEPAPIAVVPATA